VQTVGGAPIRSDRVVSALQPTRLEAEKIWDQPQLLSKRRSSDEILGTGFIHRRCARPKTAVEGLLSVGRVDPFGLGPVGHQHGKFSGILRCIELRDRLGRSKDCGRHGNAKSQIPPCILADSHPRQTQFRLASQLPTSRLEDAPMTENAIASALTALQARVGHEVHVSDWMMISQERINAFAAATDDPQWIHLDVERATRESPYGAPIAHGYLTLSLSVPLRGLVDTSKPIAPSVRNVINYGLNKLRFPNAVRVGSKIRGRFTLQAVEQVAPNVLQVTEQYTVEIEGAPKPACIAESVMRLVF